MIFIDDGKYCEDGSLWVLCVLTAFHVSRIKNCIVLLVNDMRVIVGIVIFSSFFIQCVKNEKEQLVTSVGSKLFVEGSISDSMEIGPFLFFEHGKRSIPNQAGVFVLGFREINFYLYAIQNYL